MTNMPDIGREDRRMTRREFVLLARRIDDRYARFEVESEQSEIRKAGMPQRPRSSYCAKKKGT